LIEGTYQHGLGWGSPTFWAFLANLVISAPLYSWIYNAAGRVVFAHLLLTLIVVAASWQWMKQKSVGLLQPAE